MFNKLSNWGNGRENLVFALIQGSHWAANCMLYGFWVSYLEHVGYSYVFIGLITTIMAAVGIASQPLAGYISDTFLTAKRLLILCILLSLPLVALLPFVSGSFPAVIVVISLCMSLHCSLGGIIDSWSVKLREIKPHINYPLTRAAGSAGYGLSALLTGLLISKLGHPVMFITHIIMLLLVVFFAQIPDEVPCSNQKSNATNSLSDRLSFGAALLQLVKNPQYMLFLVSAVFFNLGVRVTITFLSTIVTQKGGDSSALGIAMFIAAFCEFPIVLLFAKLSRRIHLDKLFLLAMIFGAIRVFGINLSPNVNVLLVFQLFQSLSFGLYIPLLIEYISHIVPRQINATAITVAQAVAIGLGSVVGNVIGGTILEDYGLRTFVTANTICILIGIAIFSLSFVLNKRQ